MMSQLIYQYFDIDDALIDFIWQEDLLSLKVTNELHHISIKRGIQVLHAHGFNPQCLRRRPSPDEVCVVGRSTGSL